jgi:hypothetical protein
MTSICYPPGADWSCAYEQEDLDAIWTDPATRAVAERANALAWSTLSALLGYRLSLCPVVLRPCSAGCTPKTWDQAPVLFSNYAGAPEGGVFTPYVANGSWFNGCGCSSADSCGCTTIQQIIMPSPVGEIVSIRVAGGTLNPSAYRVDNGTKLVRQDGGLWPVCQDFNLPPGADAAFTVTYYPNLAPNDLLNYAAGVLATEYYKACSGKQCRLPTGVTNITRTGLTMEVPSGLFPGGATGLREVDPIIRIYNPNGLKMQPRVMSPDSSRARVQTWGGPALMVEPH